jgi:hypothetical protein
MTTNNAEYDDYIVFVLGTDNFDATVFIRELARREGIDTAYNCCVYIAKKFQEYDIITNNYNKISQYESLCNFLDDYYFEVKEYIDEGTKFEIKKG